MTLWLVAATGAMWAALASPPETNVDALVRSLKQANPGVRGMAAMELAELGPGAKSAVPALAEAVLDRDLNVRYWAATALKAIGPDAKAAVPALVKALDTFPGGSPALDGPIRYYPDVRSGAAAALGAIGPAAKDAVPALRKALVDADASVKESAAAALKKVESAEATPR